MRQFTDHLTGQIFSLILSNINHKYKLVKTKENANFENPIGTQVNGWYIPSATTDIKLKDGTIYTIKNGQFHHITQENPITHKKIHLLHKRFVKY